MIFRGSVRQSLRRLAAAALWLAALLACTGEGDAQTATLNFRHLGTEQGLTQGSVMAILQDQRGFMWLGTQDGLDRWDGVELVHFRHHPEGQTASPSLSSNFIRALAEDRAGRVWIGTDTTGLDRYDPQTGQFSNFRFRAAEPGSLPSNRIRALALDPSGMLWVATAENGLGRLDPSTGQTIVYRHDPTDPASLIDDRLTSLLVDKAGRLWIGSRGGLDRFEQPGDKFVHYAHDPQRPESLGDPAVRALHEDSRGRIWIGTHSGLDLLEPGRSSFRHYRPHPDDPYALGNPPVRALVEDDHGRLWVGTDQGIQILDEASERFERHRNDRANPGSLSKDIVATFHRDRSGLIWVGTQGGGADIWDPAKRSFSHIMTRPWEPGSLSSDNVQAFAEIADSVFVGTHGGGLNVLDRRTSEFKVYRRNEKARGLADDRVMALAATSRGGLFIGTFASGLQRFRPQSGTFESWQSHPEDPRSLAADAIATLLEDRRGRLWIGTFFGGLDRFDEKSGEFVHYRHEPKDATTLSNNTVNVLVEAPEGGLFVGTNGGGLCYLAADDRTIVPLRGKNGDDDLQGLEVVNAIFVDPKEGLWLGTANAGLVYLEGFDRKTGVASIRRFSESEGAPEGTVWGILPDGSGHLWLSTNRGLVDFDPTTRKFRGYSTRHGLQGDEFNFGAHFRSARGELFFGGNHGYNVFIPERLRSESQPPAVVITAITKREQVLRPESLPGEPPELELDHHDSVFSIEFAALDFKAPEENRYSFRLDGFNDEWTQPAKYRPATFTNLDAGRYTFRVVAAGADGVWNREGATLRIRVLPAPWETWWAIGLYGMTAAALIGYGVKWRLAGLERAQRDLQALVAQRTGELSQTVEQLRVSEHSALDAKMRALRALEDALEERRKAQEASRAKSTFLSNISHELRTPLNAVLGFAQLMERDTGLRGDHRESLGVILRSGEHLLGLINDVLSFAKIESGRLTLSEAPFELRRVIRDVEDMIRVRADSKGLKLEVEVESALPNVSGDEGRLTQILLNLLGNAVKFTASGSVRLVVSWQAGQAGFTVIDTGCGIEEAELAQLFEPFVQARGGRQHGEGTGLGLAICHKLVSLMGGELEVRSQVGVGSTFRFAIPLPATALGDSMPRRGRVVALAPNQPPVRILVADDAAENRDLLLRLLQPLGIEVRAVADGQAAVETWSVWRPHLILMDIRMPVLDGYGAIRRIRQAEAELGGRTLIVAITATAFEHDRRRMLATGCDGVLTKPFRSQALFDLLIEQLDLRFLLADDEPRAAAAETAGEAPAPGISPAVGPASAGPAGRGDTRPESSPKPPASLEAGGVRPNAQAAELVAREASLAGRHILVVDDNDANRLVAQRALERLGCRVDIAGDGIEGLEAASVTRYDLIFMDVQMPRLDGIAAVKKLRAEEGPSREVPVVALTGLPTPDEYRRCLGAGMNDLLAKPFRLDDLRLQVERWTAAAATTAGAAPAASALDPGTGRAARPSTTSPAPSSAVGEGDGGPAGGQPEGGHISAAGKKVEHAIDRSAEAAAGNPVAGSLAARSPADKDDESGGHRVLEDTREVYVAEIIKLFLETAPFQLEALRMAAASFDLSRLAHLAATLRGSSLNFSATELASSCQRLEDLCENPAVENSRGQIGEAIDDLAHQLQRTISLLRQLQASRQAGAGAATRRGR